MKFIWHSHIARACSISQSTVHEYLKRAEVAKIPWPLPEGWDQERVEKVLFGEPRPSEQFPERVRPDFPVLHAQLQQHQQLTAWLSAHMHSFEYFGGMPRLLVPDNPRTGVSRACRYDPDLNPTYQELAMYYGVGVVPARPYRPRDKACASYCTLFGMKFREQSSPTPGEVIEQKE